MGPAFQVVEAVEPHQGHILLWVETKALYQQEATAKRSLPLLEAASRRAPRSPRILVKWGTPCLLCSICSNEAKRACQARLMRFQARVARLDWSLASDFVD